jgi:hypothetical protein
MIIENAVFASFFLEIILKFMKVPDNATDDKVVTHSDIAKSYVKSGWFFFDLIATFPFYLITVAGAAGTWFKLLRLVRIPRVMKLLEAKKINNFIRLVLNGQPRGKRVVLQLMFKNIYSVARLVMLTVIITYFLGCLFYFLSQL